MSENWIVKDERGAERCHRIMKTAVENVRGDISKGHHYVDAFCGKPVVLNISENRKMCPSCDKTPPVGNVHPRVTNAAGTSLTAAELKECGLERDTSMDAAPKKVVKRTKEAKKAVEAKVSKVKKDALILNVPLSALEGESDIAAFLIKTASSALDQLPVTTIAESKRIIRLQEKLDALARV